jgi:hypothetical protein
MTTEQMLIELIDVLCEIPQTKIVGFNSYVLPSFKSRMAALKSRIGKDAASYVHVEGEEAEFRPMFHVGVLAERKRIVALLGGMRGTADGSDLECGYEEALDQAISKINEPV